MRTKRKKVKVCVGFIATQALALVVLAAPMLAGNDTNYTYLALGDSIAFGYNPLLFPPFSPVPPLPTPAQFTGYPEVVAQVERLLQSKKEVNAACPGETSGSFLNEAMPDNGCNSPRPSMPPFPAVPPFKFSIGLHTSYTESQIAFAVSQLTSNKHINLVTLGIGGNDLLLLEEQCAAAPSFKECVMTNLDAVLDQYAANLAIILGMLRTHYAGTLVLVENYSPSADPLFITAVRALNQVMTTVGEKYGAKFADGFTAFQIGSALFGGDPCAAGLLIRLTPPPALTCDVHPSPLGRDLLAATVVLVSAGK